MKLLVSSQAPSSTWTNPRKEPTTTESNSCHMHTTVCSALHALATETAIQYIWAHTTAI